ncbi:MAG: LysM peptidoglycan-binding domain-containing protein [Flavobacteriaceae bacterium]|nr:LysM peptidoglycan-binding domain-containing protein [Flavobacteriaceae bacterium]
MKKTIFLFFLFSSLCLVAQSNKDTIATVQFDSIKNIVEEDLFSDLDISLIDSLVLDTKYNSPLYETNEYFIKDAETKDVASVVLSEDLLKARLKIIDAKTPFHIAYNPALGKVIKSYLKYRKKYYPSLIAKAEYYFPMFEKYLDQYDIPLEMKYLAIVESTLDPKARSRVGATGLWQFMYQTGKQYKLKVSSYVDERQDPIKSTIAACEYLSDLYKIFGDWDLALAAYNSGPGNVSKAIRRSGGYKNYWNIRPYLPRETAGYVPAFYATMYLFEYAKEHQLASNGPKIHHFETDTIHIKRTVSFDQISETIGIDAEILSFLNPAFKLDIIPYIEKRNYTITIPRVATVGFLKNEKVLYALADEDDGKREKPLPKYFEMDKRIRYKVRNGDYLGKIANRFGVRVRDVKKWNGLRNNRLRIGQRLSIYPKRIRIPKSTKKTTSKKTAKGKPTIYVVQKGDSLWTIAQKFKKVSVNQIKEWNNIWSAKSIKPGTKLKIFKS